MPLNLANILDMLRCTASTSSAHFRSEALSDRPSATHVPAKRVLDTPVNATSFSIDVGDDDEIVALDENINPFPVPKRPRASLDSGYGHGDTTLDQTASTAATSHSSGLESAARQADTRSRSSQAGVSDRGAGDLSGIAHNSSTPVSEPQVSMPTSGQPIVADEVGFVPLFFGTG